MQYAFKGLSLFTYRCPRAFQYAQINKIKIPFVPRDPDDETIDRRALGIELHSLTQVTLMDLIPKCGDFDLPDELDTHLINDHIALARESKNVWIEKEQCFDLMWNPLPEKPDWKSKEDFISIKPDLSFNHHGRVYLDDWKFGNMDYGATVYYDETEFFACGLAAADEGLEEVVINVHFPLERASLPERTYNRRDLAQMQEKYRQRIELIKYSKAYPPAPSRMRCQLCSFRSEDTGGSGHCNATVV